MDNIRASVTNWMSGGRHLLLKDKSPHSLLSLSKDKRRNITRKSSRTFWSLLKDAVAPYVGGHVYYDSNAATFLLPL